MEIAKGVNDATESEYRAKNRLVIKGIFGFDNGDGTAQFSSPEQMISDGIWPDEQSANKNYGPKWFLEIDENEQLSVPADLEIPVMADDTKNGLSSGVRTILPNHLRHSGADFSRDSRRKRRDYRQPVLRRIQSRIPSHNRSCRPIGE